MLFTIRSAFLFVLSGAICISGGYAQEDKSTDASDKSVADKSNTEQDEAAESDSSEKSAAQDDVKRPDFNSGKLTFEFKNTEWGKVIRWFADEAKLDLNMAVTPEGSFNYSSNGEFTLLQAMDIINSFLIREQGYILLRHANLMPA